MATMDARLRKEVERKVVEVAGSVIAAEARATTKAPRRSETKVAPAYPARSTNVTPDDC
jgi:hypothetical protein